MQQQVEEDQSEVAALNKKIRELQARIEELEEDLENERALRKRVSTMKRIYVSAYRNSLYFHCKKNVQ